MGKFFRFLVTSLLLLYGAAAQAQPDVRFSIKEGRIDNHFFREGPIAAHLLTRSGEDARLVIAFPAGNSGVGLWLGEPVQWRLIAPLKPHAESLPDGSIRRGITAELEIDARSVTINRALLGSVRVLRDHGYGNPIPPEVETEPQISRQGVTWQRRRLDGAAGYAMTLRLHGGTVAEDGGTITLTSRGPKLRMVVTGLTGDEPLTPLTEGEIFKSASGDPRLRDAVTFLSYREKLLAGSWRFNTYFGRDTLMTLSLMLPQLKPAAIEAGLGAVIERLNPQGEVAHEEGVGEFALIGRPGHDARVPVLDYAMVDDDFMLGPVVAAYLLDTPEGRERAASFLARKAPSGRSYGELLERNLGFVRASARPFAQQPSYKHLVSLKPGIAVGDWRDSTTGLGGDGRYSFSVNAALVPAALDAVVRLEESGLLEPFGPRNADSAEDANLARIWATAAPRLFAVNVPGGEAATLRTAYARNLGIGAVQSGVGPVEYLALALDEAGKPLSVIHSDIGFMLLFNRPDDALIQLALGEAMRRFPAGLMTEAGMVVANPALAEPERAAQFDNSRYHGAVVWSWHHGLLKSGIACQLQRSDLTQETRALIEQASHQIARAIDDTAELQASELWSWRYRDGKFEMLPFGQALGHETESNAAQLWSAVALGGEPLCPAAP